MVSSSLVGSQGTTGSKRNIFNLMFIEFGWYELLLCVSSNRLYIEKNELQLHLLLDVPAAES